MEVLETRQFECLCGIRAKYEIYVRNLVTHIFSCLECGKHYHFDWKTDKFISDAKPLEFRVIQEEHERADEDS